MKSDKMNINGNRKKKMTMIRYANENRSQSSFMFNLLFVLLGLLVLLPISSIAQDQSKASQGDIKTFVQKVNALLMNGDYEGALVLAKQMLAFTEKTFGPQSSETCAAMESTAMCCKLNGDYTEALSLLERASMILEKSHVSDDSNIATLIGYKAGIYLDIGEPAKSIPLSERALSIAEKKFGTQSSEITLFIIYLADAYSDIGDYSKSLTFYTRAIAIIKKTKGAQNIQIAIPMNGLAMVYSEMGDKPKALSLYEQVLEVERKNFGPEHPSTAGAMVNLARGYKDMGDYARALTFCKPALLIMEKAYGSQHPLTASCLNNLASIHQDMGDKAKALPLYERALAIREKAYGPQHPHTANSLRHLADFYYKDEDSANARAFASRWVSSTHHQLQGILAMDERSRLTWQASHLVYSLEPCVLRPEQMGQIVLRWKGIVLDSLIEDRAMAAAVSNDSEGRQKLGEIQQLRASMSKLAFSDKQADRDQSEQIASRIADLERSIASRTTILGRVRQSADITLDAVLPALADGTVLLDFFQYMDLKLNGKSARCYGLLLLDKAGEPKIVRIDGAEVIDQAIADSRSAIAKGDEPALESGLKNLSEKLWQPIAAQLPPTTKKLLIGPDGALNFLSFVTLHDAKGQFLAEKYEIAYVGSGRDLAKPTANRQNKNLEVFANPVFDQSVAKAPTSLLAMRAAEVTAFGEVHLPQLPGTQAEGTTLSETAKKAGWAASVHFGPDATEQQIRAIKKPDILHLATHGFYLNTMASTGDGTRGMKVSGLDDQRPRPASAKDVDPMRASGIALSGAQATLKAWSDGKAPDPQNDGILTAEEVAGLDLEGTWLVTLSACETGVGEAKSGEGVFGLRRAFMMAGAQNLLMTLWPVSDNTTTDIMADFYRRALASGDAPGSLSETQRDWLVKLRKEKGLLAAVRDAGPFVLATTGKLPEKKAAGTSEPVMSQPKPSGFVR